MSAHSNPAAPPPPPDPYQPPQAYPPAQFQPTPWAEPPIPDPPYQQAPRYESPASPYAQGPQAYEEPGVPDDLFADQPRYLEPDGRDPGYPGYYAADEPPDRSTKWIVGGIVAVLAFAAIVLSGLALINRSHHHTNSQKSSTSGRSSRSSTSKSTSSGSASAAPKPVRSVTLTATASGTKYTVSIWAEDTQKDCAAHAYGTQVVNYLKKYPCSAMTRRVGTTTVNGKGAGFALSVITIPGPSAHPQKYAGDFLKLVSKDGTGNLSDLLREGKRLPSGPRAVPSPDAFSVDTKDTTVIVVDAWYLSGKTPTNDPPLTKLAGDFFLQKGVG